MVHNIEAAFIGRVRKLGTLRKPFNCFYPDKAYKRKTSGNLKEVLKASIYVAGIILPTSLKYSDLP